MSKAHDYAKANAEQFRSQLLDLLRIPSVSTDPAHVQDVRRGAEWVADSLRQAGLETVEVMPTAGHPVVYAEWLGAGQDAKTVLVYGHYDVQPAVIEDGWDSHPFEPAQRDGKIYARGASDDKGQVFVHVKAVESWMQSTGKLPVKVKFLIEGEEEIGSPNLTAFVKTHRDRLQADVCVISDTGMPRADQPSITYALRGLVAMELEVRSATRDLHSGGYGGTVHNPLQALAEIIAQLHNPDGSVSVPGFYDDVLTVSEEERAELARMAMSEAEWRAQTGGLQPWGEPGYTIEERIGIRPTLEINGMAGGFYGEGFKTVLPAKALAKISCRLVANQNPHRIFQLVHDYIHQIAPPTIQVETRDLQGGHPSLVDIRSPEMQAAVRAYEKGWGSKPAFGRSGGSIPVVADFQQELGTPVILMGYGLDSDGAHGPNECFSIEMFHKGIDTAIHYLEEVSK